MSEQEAARLCLGLLVAAAGCAPAGPREAVYVGSAACAECHAAAAELVAGRAHNLAMRPAADSTVSGRFDGSRLVRFGTTTEFFRRDSAYLVRTPGGDGRVADFEVRYVLGLGPLEQYLVPGRGGRYQVLPFAWDTRTAAQGGVRWLHIYSSEPVPPGDELHWAGPLQTWNYMCAECHVTGITRNYDLGTDSYHTSW